MMYWWPRVSEAGDIPVPRTVLVSWSREEATAIIGTFDRCADEEVPECVERILELVYLAVPRDRPSFMRGVHTSGKHNWKRTCHVPAGATRSVVADRFWHLAEVHESYFWLSGELFEGVAVREMIQTRPIFHTFYGEMPITREFRYFYHEGRVVCHHPYWPPAAIARERRYSWGGGLPDDWRARLEAISQDTPGEVERLTVLAERIGRAVEHPDARSWSIDFLEDANGDWWFIDCAVAERSSHWYDCPVAMELGLPVDERGREEEDEDDIDDEMSLMENLEDE
jgi:hypothetical protein